MSVEVKDLSKKENASKKTIKVIDTDVHHDVRSTHDLLPYLSDNWKRYITDYGWKPIKTVPFNQVRKGSKYRNDTFVENAPPGSDFEFVKKQLLDENEITYAVLDGWFHEATVTNGWFEFAAARASAYNDYTIEKMVK